MKTLKFIIVLVILGFNCQGQQLANISDFDEQYQDSIAYKLFKETMEREPVDMKAAREYLFYAYATASRLNHDRIKKKSLVAMCSFYNRMGYPDSAQSACRQALKMGHEESNSYAYNSLGVIYENINIDSALQYYMMAKNLEASSEIALF